MSDYEGIITGNSSDSDSDRESEISVNGSGSNESFLSYISYGVKRMYTPLWNAFVLYQKLGRKLSHLNFRLDIIDRRTERHDVVNEKKERPGILSSLLRLAEKNFLEVIPPTEKN
ncbi:piggyBac transposable element-derived protein 4 [Trichonephila clavipes]|nr:piggyBac transposable element-derived protein 4 [Trichonephila clavipes]